jgi:hypothetical protein
MSTAVETNATETPTNNQHLMDQNRKVEPNQPVGDIMTIPKDNSKMRLYMQNPNGISIGAMGELDMILAHLKHMEVDMFIFPETNRDTHKPRVKKQVHN